MPMDVYFDSGLQGWIKRYAREQHWRVAGWYSMSDLAQDGIICYCKCRDRYVVPIPKEGCQNLFTIRPNEPQRKHFMDLVQKSFRNHILTLAARHPAFTEEPVDCGIGEDSNASIERLLPPQSDVAQIAMILASAPAEITEAIQRIIVEGLEGEPFRRSRLRRHDGRVTRGRRALRETSNEYYERLFGDSAIPQKLAAYLLS